MYGRFWPEGHGIFAESIRRQAELNDMKNAHLRNTGSYWHRQQPIDGGNVLRQSHERPGSQQL